MPNEIKRISGWLFFTERFDGIVFVPRHYIDDRIELPWNLLLQPELWESFRREFSLKGPRKIRNLRRYELNADFCEVHKWLLERSSTE